MSERELADGESIEVGDVIVAEHRGIGGTTRTKVSRVTPRWAFARVTDVHEMKVERIYRSFGFEPRPRTKWRTTHYYVNRPA